MLYSNVTVRKQSNGVLKIWTGVLASVTTSWGDRGSKEWGNSNYSFLRPLVAGTSPIVHIITIDLASSAAAMTQIHGENPQRSRAGVHHIRARMQSQSRLALKRVRNIRKDDVKGFFIRNAFVLFTVSAVVIGEWKRIFFLSFFCLDTEMNSKIPLVWSDE